MGRVAAASIAAVAFAGLIVQFVVTYLQNGSALHTLWILIAYFTITTNLLVAVVFSAIALDRSALRSSSMVAGTTLCILLVGVIYYFLLHGMVELSGGSQVANVLLHMATPILVPIFWLVVTPKGRLKWNHPWSWATYPLAYLAYALLRGTSTGRYPYPFVDVAQFGWQQVAFNSVVIAAAFLFCSFAIVWLDHRMAVPSAT